MSVLGKIAFVLLTAVASGIVGYATAARDCERRIVRLAENLVAKCSDD